MTNGNAVIVVLGDIGHSPRMCYHAHSLAQQNVHVDIVGYAGSKPHENIVNHENIRLVEISGPPNFLSNPKIPRVAQLLAKFAWTFWLLFIALLFRISFSTSLILLQNPPGIPSMFVCWLVARLKGAAFVVDWHNYTYTILQQGFPKKSNGYKQKLQNLFVNFSSRWEGFFGVRADFSVCVSNAMRADLKERWKLTAVTLHDKPPSWNFVSLNLNQKHELLHRLFNSRTFEGEYNYDCSPDETPFTVKKDGKVTAKPDRPLLLMSSTSWTEDEDFGILLDALVGYGKQAELTVASANQCLLPKLFVVITGKGPQKLYYMDKIASQRLYNVEVVTAWLQAEDYPKLLSCADLGVSLHTSSSGLDLPMKIVDMFGCSLPVLAKRFHAIDEQIQENVNGRLFDTPSQLRQHLIELAGEFPNNNDILTMKKNLIANWRTDWHSQWLANLWPVIQPAFAKSIEANQRWERFKHQDTVDSEDDEEKVNERNFDFTGDHDEDTEDNTESEKSNNDSDTNSD